jgi:hypothetical protein
VIEFSNQHLKKQSPPRIPQPVLSSDTTRNRPSHQPTRSRSQSSRSSGRIPPSSFSRAVSSPQKILLSPLMSPLNSKSFTPFVDFPLPPLTECSNFISSSTDSSSSSDDSLDHVSTIPPPFNYKSPKHQQSKRLQNSIAFEIENDFIPYNSQNNIPRTPGNKFESKKMSYEENFGKLNSYTNYDNHGKQEKGKRTNKEEEEEKNKMDRIRSEVENYNNKRNVKYKH